MKTFLYKILRIKPPIKVLDEKAVELKNTADSYVHKQLLYLEIPELERLAISRIRKKCHNDYTFEEIRKKLLGTTELLQYGQTTYILYSDFLKESQVASSLMQPFSIAVEIMMYITFIHIANDEELRLFIENSSKPVSYLIDNIENKSLKVILRDYRKMRNLAAHTYQLISIDAANSFILRTYENIQRMELIINPAE